MEIKELHLFPTLVMGFNLKNDIDATDLLNFYQGIDHDLVRNGTSTYYRDNNILKSFPEVKNKIQECIDIYSEKMSLGKLIICDSWMNRMSLGSKTMPHRHPGSVCSGVYYPKIDDDSASLIFHNPLTPYKMNEIFHEENTLNTYFNYFPPTEGTLFIFPSWLEHETEINNTEERYALSFNTDRFKS